MEYSIWVQNLPLPPSVNNYLMPVGSRLVKTPVFRAYDAEFSMWVLRNKQHVENIRSKIDKLMLDCDFGLQVDMYFCFHKPRVYTLAGAVQEMDRDNRIKPATDQIKKIIGIDDRYIFSGNSEKVTTEKKEDECLIVKISSMKPRTKQDILSLIHSEVSQADKEK